jgi:hypothetical protein
MAAKTSGVWGDYLNSIMRQEQPWQKKQQAGVIDPAFAQAIASGDPNAIAFVNANGGNLPQPGAMQGPAPSNLTPTIMPFLSAEDLINLAQFSGANESTLAQIDAALAQQQTDTAYQKKQLDKDALKATTNTQDQMAARGLFQSSIKDAALYDIEGQKTMRQGLLDDQLHNAQLSASRQKQIIQDSIARMNAAMSLRAVENAGNASQGAPNTTGAGGGQSGAAAPGSFASYQGTPVEDYLRQAYAASQGTANGTYVNPAGQTVAREGVGTTVLSGQPQGWGGIGVGGNVGKKKRP